MSSVLLYTKHGIIRSLVAAFGNDGIYRPPGNTVIEEVISLAHTEEEDNPWWMVDLEDVYCIWAVRILNRGILFKFLF